MEEAFRLTQERGVIYGSSSDPVLIKKISLKIWTLRDEIEAVIRKRLKSAPIPTEGTPADPASIKEHLQLSSLIEEYTKTHTPPAPTVASTAGGLSLIQGGGGQNPGAQMPEATAAAPAEGEAAVAPPAEEATAPAEDAQAALDPATTAAATQDAPSSDGVTIYQRHPELPEDAYVHGRMVLSEIDINKLFCFCTERFTEGQSILIEFLVPKRFVLSAKVAYCRNYTIRGRILRERKLTYRLMAKFTFERPGERTLLRQFLESITPDVPSKKGKPKAQGEAAGEADELADLDI